MKRILKAWRERGLTHAARVVGFRAADLWHERAAKAGVLFQSGTSLAFDGRPLPHLRLGFACCDERELATAAERLARSCPRPRAKATPKRSR